ncbi:cytochrome c biogenesis protein CcdA [Methylocapsa palsarum]|uniref:Cytochrome C biogenesis protein transmembrane region n=1 Tax=Methylocapsa palsarum TaxID=1612308 RepID=A0A1I4A3Y4_9HYPH|nr:cytochrome c biogenesis protein CcdA [Methylocapsa palsarum]SFK51054.1 Cytochrome C biogenesis protein transmembrane region [Methylocapsa palsarum]
MTILALAFLAGLLAILSPCILPLAPIVAASARAQDPRGPLALALGLALTFGLVGGALASAGIEFGNSAFLRASAASLMLAAGLVMLFPLFSARAERLLAPLSRWGEALAKLMPKAGLAGQAGAGVVLAFAWAPCAGPTLGAAFALAANGGSIPMAMTTMTVFALGAATALLAAGYGLSRIAARTRIAAARAGRIGNIALAIVLIGVGAAILTGFDRAIETAFADAMPGWLIAFAARL